MSGRIGKQRVMWAGCVMLLASSALVALAQDEVSVEASAEVRDTAALLNRVISELRSHGLELDADEARQAAVEAVIRSADAHSAIMTDTEIEQWSREQEGHGFSIGVSLTMTNGLPRVSALTAGGAAEAAEIEVDDVITAVDGSDIGPTDIVSAQKLLSGTEAGSVQLNIRKADGSTREVTAALTEGRVPGIESSEVLPTGLCYLRVNGLYPGTGDAILRQIDEWRAGEYAGLIFDLRGANGGDTDSAARISSLFAEAKMMLFAFRDHADQDVALSKAEDTEPIGMPTMVLIDGATSGAAEVLAASMKRSIRGSMLIGSETQGDPGIREFVDFTPTEKIYVATRRLVTADGTIYTGKQGVIPDVTVAESASRAAEYDQSVEIRNRERLEEEVEDLRLAQRVKGDAVLRRAVDILQGLKALNIRGVQRSHATSS